MRGVDLFAGWGGLTCGASAAGVDVVWAGNHWPLAVSTHQQNHPAAVHVCQDLRQADWTALPHFDLLLSAPACQAHSNASQPGRRPYHDAMRATAWAVVDCADATNPAGILVENVPQLRNWRLYPQWRGALEALGYVVEERVLTASRLGVPQRRTRLFVFATRPGHPVPEIPLESEEPAFGPCLDTDVPDAVWKPVGRATPNMRARIEKARQRHGSRFLTQQVTNHPGVPLHEPIRTITTAAQHWNLVDGDRYRALTGRELARGMGFPDTYMWDESLSVADVTRGIGNAVCPPVAEAAARALMEAVG